MSKNKVRTESKVHNIDARKFNEILKDKIIDVTITSPPYFDLKDYGYKNQIGYGQEYQDYLDDLEKVFKNVFDCTKDTGTLWVIIDAFRRDGEVVPLPFDFSNKIKNSGWKLQEVIIWGKDRTVPWTHKGQMRNLFEYILVFSKSEQYNFYVDEVRDYVGLKKWWVRYPERYNPGGKTPDAIWHFDIPTQGSWGNGYIKHFCPLPEEMIEQILKLTTKEGDIVLDPFAGSGAVLSKADSMNRKYIGFELNKGYIKMFNKYLSKTSKEKKQEYELSIRNRIKQNDFKKLIIDLRVLKYGKIIYQKLANKLQGAIIKIFIAKSTIKPSKKNYLTVANYNILILGYKKKFNIEQFLNDITTKPPLSKFGIEPSFNFLINIDSFINLTSTRGLYTYTVKDTHKIHKEFSLKRVMENSNEVIVSKIKIDLNEKDHE